MSEKASSKIRIQNITLAVPGLPRGMFLDLGGSHLSIASGKSGYGDKDKLTPEQLAMIDTWCDSGYARVWDAVTGELLQGTPVEKLPVAVVSDKLTAAGAVEVDKDVPFDGEIDLTEAVEADLPLNAGTSPGVTTGAHLPDNNNVRPQGAKITGVREEQQGGHNGLSPIPGMTPRSVDESDKFTVRAPSARTV